MGIDKAIEILKDTIKKLNGDMEIVHTNYNKAKAIETLINEYSNLKQIEEAHRIENGELREEIKDLKETLDNTWSGFKGIQEDLTNQLGNMPPEEYF